MRKLLTLAVVLYTLASCTKSEYDCAEITNIRVSSGFIIFDFDNGTSQSTNVRTGDDYSHLSDLNECEFFEARKNSLQ